MSTCDSFVRANNRLWGKLFYSHNFSCDQFDLWLLPRFPQMHFLNAASALQTETLEHIEAIMTPLGLVKAIWIHSDTPQNISDSIARAGYREVQEEAEIWHIIDLSKKDANTVPGLRCPSSEVEVIDLAQTYSRELLEAFCHISLTTNQAPQLTEILENNLQRHIASRSIYPLLALVKGEPAATLCLGYEKEHSFVLLVGTLERFRGLGLASFLRQLSVHRARRNGSRYLSANILANNRASLHISESLGFSQTFNQSLWISDDKTSN